MTDGGAKDVDVAPVLRQRPPHDEATILRMRRERIDPRPGQWDELHLRVLRDGLARALDTVPPAQGAVLDLWCGAKPYAPLIPGRVIGVDLDRHFGSADVIGVPPLPFRDGAFSGALCSQALHIVDDPKATVDELHRLVVPGGWAIITVPDLMLRAGPSKMEGRLEANALRQLFAEWADVTIDVAGGPGAALAHAAGLVASVAVRRLRLPEGAARALYAGVNGLGKVVDILGRPLRRRFPHLLIVVARKAEAPRDAAASPPSP